VLNRTPRNETMKITKYNNKKTATKNVEICIKPLGQATTTRKITKTV
jgi:hypothetical protein